MAFVKPDGTTFSVRTEDVIGVGQSGIVLRRGVHALKIAKVRNTSDLTNEKCEAQEYMNEVARDILQNEKAVYQRIGHHPGIADCVTQLQDGILLVLYTGGNLDRYISRNHELDWWEKRNWILSIIETVTYLHESRVLIDDLALRNLVIAEDFSLKMVDFGQCAILPTDSDLRTVNLNGLTAKVDIFHLGCLIYSVAAWQRYESDLLDLDPYFPPLKDLPAIDHLPCASILRKCWTGGYADIYELRIEASRNFTISIGHICSYWLRRLGTSVNALQRSLPGSF